MKDLKKCTNKQYELLKLVEATDICLAMLVL